jgi:hypothetical protein
MTPQKRFQSIDSHQFVNNFVIVDEDQAKASVKKLMDK